MQKIFGIYNASYIFATALGALIGGIIANNQSLDEFYLLYKLIVIFQIIGLIIFLSLREPQNDDSLSEEYNLNQLLKGAKHIFSSKKLLNLVLLSLFTLPLSLILLRVQQPYFEDFKVDSFWFGGSIFISSIIIVFVKIYAYKLEEFFNTKIALLISTILPGIFWILMALAFSPIIAIILFILNDVSGNVRDPIFADYFNKYIPDSIRTTTLSTISFINAIYVGIFQIIFGLFITRIGYDFAFIVVGSVIIISSIIFLSRININSMQE
jgi:sugar phosphate permease